MLAGVLLHMVKAAWPINHALHLVASPQPALGFDGGGEYVEGGLIFFSFYHVHHRNPI
jgi:hypothetical protein